MSTLFIFIVLFIAFFLIIFKHIKTGILTLGLALISFLAIGTGWMPAILLGDLQASFVDIPLPAWKKQNAIVLLGAGTVKMPISHVVNPTLLAYSRINAASRLYLACVKNNNHCTIIISGGDASHTGKSESLVYQEALIHLGVQDADILLETHSMNTYENAKLTSAILKKDRFDQVILVTSGIHMRRSLLYFSHFGIHAEPVIADYVNASFNFIPLGYYFALTDFAIHEYVGILRLHVYNFLGWNKNDSFLNEEKS
jgi:uncharacterized SAM-binding protein YcdF (DUF218 family)